jgi:hypothetical protein
MGHGGTRWKLEAESEREPFSFPGTFKTYATLWEGKRLVIPNQKSMNGEGLPGPGEGSLSCPLG